MRFVAERCAHSEMLVSADRGTDGAGTDQYSTLDATTADSRCESIGRSVTRPWRGIGRTNIFDRVALASESGLQNFLGTDSAAVRTDSYPHDISLRPRLQSLLSRTVES